MSLRRTNEEIATNTGNNTETRSPNEPQNQREPQNQNEPQTHNEPQNQDGVPRTNIESTPSISQLELRDEVKIDSDPELNICQERVIQVISVPQPETIISTTLQASRFNSPYDNIPLDPPPYSEFPIYTIPIAQSRDGSTMYDPPPPYDPTMRREVIDALDFPFDDYQPQTRRSRFECKPDTLVPLGFCYCTLEQLIVTLAILGTFVFLFLGQIS